MNVSVILNVQGNFGFYLGCQGILQNLGFQKVIVLIFNILGVFLVILLIRDIIVILEILRIFWTFEDLDGFLVNLEVPWLFYLC